MRTKTHFAVTLLLSYLLFYFLFEDNIVSLILAVITASFSTVPDYDWRIYSWANRQYVKLQKSKVLKFLFFPYYLFILVLIKVFRHRTTTHSLFFPFLIYIIAKFVNTIIVTQLLILIAIASFLHIFEDIFTVSGVPLFYPISKKLFKVPVINTKEDLKKQKIIESVSYILLVLTFLLL